MLPRLLLAAACAAVVAAQEPAAEVFGHSRHGAEFDDGPRRAALPMPGLSSHVHFPVAGLDAPAQALFDQGLTQQHGFWYFEAERSFREVARLHPDCALAYWGMAMANVENPERGAGFAAMAVQRAAALCERERLYVDALAALYTIDAAARTELQSSDPARVAAAKAALVAKNKDGRDEKVLQRAFLKGLEAVVHACPDDVEAKALLAIQSWRNVEHGIEISSHGAVDALLDHVFTKAPLHPAHHYRVHLWDREQAERALRSAAVLGDTAPAIAHQWHMAGHVYARLHRHAEAAWQQDASARVDHAHMASARVMPFQIHNYAHNQEWLARSLTYVGDGERALAVATNLAELPRHPRWNSVDDGQHAAGYARARIVQICEDLELWERAVELCTDGHLEPGTSVKTDVQRLGLLGRALFRLGRLDEAERVVAETDVLLARARTERAAAIDLAESEAHAKKESDTKVREAVAEAGRKPSGTVRAVLDLQRELRGERLLANGDATAALAELEAIGDLPKPLLADVLVAAGRVEQAIGLLEHEVKERPGRVPSLARLVLAYDAAMKPETDERAQRRTRARLDLDSHTAGGTGGGLLQRCGVDTSRRARPGPSLTLATGDGEPLFADAEYAVGADFGPRPPLASLGPLAWAPFGNAGFELPLVGDANTVIRLQPDGRTLELRDGAVDTGGHRPTLVVFYLGFGCLQCVEQLHALSPHTAAFAAAGIDVLAIGNEPVAAARDALAALPADKRFVFPLLADPELATFRAWHCFDDFEQIALHGTFLVDAHGAVRWQDLGATPFTDFVWLLGESRRLLSLRGGQRVTPPSGTPSPAAVTVANTPEALRAHVASLHAQQLAGNGDVAARALLAMVPDEARLRRALADDVPADKLAATLALYESLRGRPMTQIADARNTEVRVHAATTAELAAYADGSVARAEFPGGASELAKAGTLRAGTTFHEVELVAPGADSGMKYHLFFHDGAGWSMLGPVWRAFQ